MPKVGGWQNSSWLHDKVYKCRYVYNTCVDLYKVGGWQHPSWLHAIMGIIMDMIHAQSYNNQYTMGIRRMTILLGAIYADDSCGEPML